jgi:hypothetical protein
VILAGGGDGQEAVMVQAAVTVQAAVMVQAAGMLSSGGNASPRREFSHCRVDL